MKAVELTNDIPEQGLSEGDVIHVDELSAQSMISAKKAKEYDPEKAKAGSELEEVEYAGQKVRTIDDIVDPDAKRMKGVMHVQRLVGADPGPARTGTAKTAAEAEAPAPTTEQPAVTDTTETPRLRGGRGGRGASGADPAGGDATDGGTS